MIHTRRRTLIRSLMEEADRLKQYNGQDNVRLVAEIAHLPGLG
jgi:hypothetical protein